MKRLALATFAFAVLLAPAHSLDRLVTVTGEATVAVAPDSAVIRIGVTSRGPSAREANDANAKAMTSVLAAFKDAGVAERDVQTSRVSLQPQLDPNKSGTAPLIGFEASNQVTVRVRAIDNLPAIVDRAISAGVKLGRAVAITDEGSSPPRPVVALRSSAVPIAPGKQTLRAAVTVSYQLTP